MQMSAKILYVEDEPFLARIVSDGLKSSGYQVCVVGDGALVLEQYLLFKPDICILDVMLPSKDGYVIAKELKALAESLPIIFLTARVLTEDVIKGFHSGGNDYLKKPFSMDELLVRIESMLQLFGKTKYSTPELPQTVYAIGTCELDVVKQTLSTAKGIHSLSFKESSLLQMLIVRKNQVLKRQDALIEIWGSDSYYNTRSMDVFMAHLRKLLVEDQHIQIITLRGIGYKLVC